MDVFFETESGSTFSIELGYWDTVLEIKQKIDKYQHIHVHKQTLFFNGKILQDHLDIDQCDIFVNSRLQVFVSSSPSHNQELQTEQSLPSNSSEQIKIEVDQQTEQSPQFINDQDSSMNVRSNKNKNDQVLKTEQSPLSNPTTEVNNIQDSPVTVQVLRTEQSPTLNSTEQFINDQDSSVNVNKNGQVLETEKSPVSNPTNEVINIPDSPVIVCGTKKSGQVIETEEYLYKVQDSRTTNKRRMVIYVLSYSGKNEEAKAKKPVCVTPNDNVKELRKELVKYQEKGWLNLPQQGYFLIHEMCIINEEQSFASNGINPTDTIKIYPRNSTRSS